MREGIFVGIDKAIMERLAQATQGQMAFYAELMSGLVTVSITLYIVVRGYQMIAGKVPTPFEDILWDLARMGIILAFMSNIDGYLDASIVAINGLKEGFSGHTNSWQLLDALWAKSQVLAQTIHDLDNDTFSLIGEMGSGMVWLGAIVALLISTMVFMSAEITLLLLTVTAPVFIFCLMYGFLRPMFNNWLQIIFSSMLTILFAALVINVSIHYYGEMLTYLSVHAAEHNLLTLGAMACTAGIVAGFIVWLSAKIAFQLAGVGVEGTLQGMAAMGFGTAGLAAGKLAKGGMRYGGKAVKGAYQGWMGRERSTDGSSARLGYYGVKGTKALAKAAVEKMKARCQ